MTDQFNINIAVIDNNTLATIGLRQLLMDVFPIMKVSCFGSFSELQANHPENFVHYFVSTSIILENRNFFLDNLHKTIAITLSNDSNSMLSDFHCLCANVPEKILVKNLLNLVRMGHSKHPDATDAMPKQDSNTNPLSDREIEVLSLVAQGYINKEIANQLNISITTVISHRKNIQEKLGLKSISALTIYAVMHGYVDINKI